MKIAIMQPTFNPWLGYFDLIDYVDKFIFLDTVKINKQSWQTRNKFKINSTEYLFSLPLEKNSSSLTLLDAKLAKNFNPKKFIKTIEKNFRRASYFDEVFPIFQQIMLFETDYLSKFNVNLIETLAVKLGQDSKKFHVASSLKDEFSTTKTQRLIDICKFFDANEYISPLGSKAYIDSENYKFSQNKIKLFYQHYAHPIYNQLGKDFMPYMGIFDLLFNQGFENSKSIITSGRNFILDV